MKEDPGNGLFKDQNIYIIFSITLLAIMGVSSITPAFPEMIRHFKISDVEIGLLITVFTLPGIFLAPFFGVLADRYGRKKILLPSIFFFGLGGFLCTFTNDYQVLLLFRFIQGVGAAALGMINITLVGDLYTGVRRAAVMGYNASVLSIGTASYPAIGGVLATMAWYYPFYLPLLAIPVGAFVIFALDNPEPTERTDLKGYLMRTWKTININEVWALFLVTILLFVILYGSYLTFFPLLLENDFQASAMHIGFVMSGMSLTTAIVSSQLGRLRSNFGARSLLIFSIIMYAIALLLIYMAHNWIVVSAAVLLFGIGHGMIIPNVQTLLVGFASINERAAFMSVNSMVLRIGQTAGPVGIGLFYQAGGLRATFLAGMGVAVMMLLIVLTMFGRRKEGE